MKGCRINKQSITLGYKLLKMIHISHFVGRREENFLFLLFLEKVTFPNVILWYGLEDTGYKCSQIVEINIMKKHLPWVQKWCFGFFMYDVSSGTEPSFTFPGNHMENITVYDAWWAQICYGFSPGNSSVLTQLLSVHYVFKNTNHKVSLLIHLCKITDLTTWVFLG